LYQLFICQIGATLLLRTYDTFGFEKGLNPFMKKLNIKTMQLIINQLKKNRLIILVFFFLLSQQDATAQQTPIQGAQTLHAHFRGKTKPLRDLAAMPGSSREKQIAKKANKPNFMPPNFINYRRQAHVNPNALPQGEDPIRQSSQYRTINSVIEPRVVFEGIDEANGNAGVPDTNGEISAQYFFQIINASFFRIFDRDGTPLTSVTSANTLWNEIGEQSFSDPVVMYDEDADRWLLTDLGNIDLVLYGVSETADPLGAWNLYSFNAPGFTDYPKYGIWPNAYILTTNEGASNYPVYAFNRQQMLNGESTIDVQRIEIPGLDGGFPTATPMDWNSPMAPPSDEVFVVRLNDDSWGNGIDSDQIEVWTINIDWETAANTTTSSTFLQTAPYDTDGCSVSGGGFACIPQPGTSQGIDGIMTIIMNNVAYWNYGTHESAVLTFSVNAGNDVAGIRWMELRREPGSDWTIYQEGTYAPDDGVHRFIGSIAINGKGDIGLAYSVSGENTFPSLRYTGRNANDPLGQMTIDEYEFATGESSRNGDRYGDYAKMSIDPVDDSFWFTSEYMVSDGAYSTKIVNFVIRKDTLDLSPIALNSPQNSPDLTDSEEVSIQIKNIGLDTAIHFSVGYIFGNNASVIEDATIDTLLPDSVYTHTFIPTVDMSIVGDYEFKIFSIFGDDQNTENDTLTVKRQKVARFDAAITNIEGLDGILCDSTTIASLGLTNFGADTLTSVTIEYQLNGGITQSLNWTGSLAYGEHTLLDVLLEPLVTGTNIIATNILNPNGTADEIPANDHYTKEFRVLLNGISVALQLTFDDFPEETSWLLQDSNGDILFEGGTYPGQENETITQEWCLDEEECYTFIINDSYGDGMTSFTGNEGSYTIVDVDGNAYTSIMQANFGYEEVNNFCLVLPCNVAADFDITNASTGDSSDGAILVSPTSGISPFIYSIDGGITTQENPLFSDLSAGDYNITVIDVNGCTFDQQLTVEITVGSYEVVDNYNIFVAPNPSKNGAFWVTVEGLDGYSTGIDLQIIDAVGRPVLYKTLTSVDNYHKGLVSLRNYPAGIYYIRFKNDQINQLLRIVRL